MIGGPVKLTRLRSINQGVFANRVFALNLRQYMGNKRENDDKQVDGMYPIVRRQT